MINIGLVAIAAVQQPGGQTVNGHWLTLLVVLAGVAVLMLIIRGVGLVLAKQHPEPAPKAAPVVLPPPAKELPPEVIRKDPDLQTVAAIAAAVSIIIPRSHRITQITPIVQNQDYSVEALMQIWSMEGRRQIYSTHRIR